MQTHKTILASAVVLLPHLLACQVVAETTSAAVQSKPDVLRLGNPAGDRELIRDNQFRSGFLLLDPTPGKRVPYGRIPGPEGNPIWDLAQWSSKFPLTAGSGRHRSPQAIYQFNQAKAISFGGRSKTAFDLSMAVNASQEYGQRSRRKGEPWVHLLVQQDFDAPPFLVDLKSARLHIEVRLAKSRRTKTEDYTPSLHAAQFQMFLTVQNRNRQSPGYGKYLWFGIPLYDDRSRFPKAHKSRDFGGTGMFIFTPGGETYSSVSAHDREWITVDEDLLPLMREALETAWSRGFLQESKAMADYCIGGMNLGWEVPGIFDVELQVRNLSLKVTGLK